MQVKHNHQCNLTSKMTTCFVFTEFPLVFAISREGYDQLVDTFPLFPVSDHYCSLCENRDNVRQLIGFNDTTFFSDLFICEKCFRKIREKVNEKDGSSA